MMQDPGTLTGARHVLGIADEAYPDSLRRAESPPDHLYVIGDPQALQPGLAIVGARRATPYGLGAARRFARIAAEKGVVIISGGARGCDSEAHRAAIDAGGRTVAFLGGGCDMLYPPEHHGLFQRIVDTGGAVASEHPWGRPPLPYAFRARNRLIAGLAEAVLIVEAGLPSGTFSTADNALDSGKDVLVVPGAITSDASRGSNRLLLQGAVPVIDDESFEDAIFRSLGMLKWPNAATLRAGGPENDQIVEAVLAQPCTMDELYRLSAGIHGAGLAQAKLMEALVAGETRGLIARQPDGKWGPAVPA